MITSGFSSAIHFFEGSKPRKSGCQYGSPDFPLSIAAPMAGTSEVATPATILAMVFPLRFAAIAFDRTAAMEHHVGVLLLRRTGHLRRQLLEGEAVERAELRGEVDVAAEFEHLVPIAVGNRFGLLGRHRKLLFVAFFVGAKRGAVLFLHQRHAEHVAVSYTHL